MDAGRRPSVRDMLQKQKKKHTNSGSDDEAAGTTNDLRVVGGYRQEEQNAPMSVPWDGTGKRTKDEEDGKRDKRASEAVAREDLPYLPIAAFSRLGQLRVRSLTDRHPLFDVEGFATDSECARILEIGEPLLKRRTARLTVGGRQAGDPVLHAIVMRVVGLSGYPVSHIEAVTLVRCRHREGEEERHDYLEPGHGGQRIMTFLVYLNDVPGDAGGATLFPRLGGLRVQPRRGNATMWMNTSLDGERLCAATLRATTPVKHATRNALSIWVRQSEVTDNSDQK